MRSRKEVQVARATGSARCMPVQPERSISTVPPSTETKGCVEAGQVAHSPDFRLFATSSHRLRILHALPPPPLATTASTGPHTPTATAASSPTTCDRGRTWVTPPAALPPHDHSWRGKQVPLGDQQALVADAQVDTCPRPSTAAMASVKWSSAVSDASSQAPWIDAAWTAGTCLHLQLPAPTPRV